MRSLKHTPLITLCILLTITCLLVYRPTDSSNTGKAIDLKTVFGPVAGYRMINRQLLEDSIVSFLELDDYTSVTYEREGEPVSLYIGYYFSLDKVSAAHSPLVCFPGQGWSIDIPEKKRLQIDGKVVNYSEMVAGLGDRRELILYWYQAYDDTAREVYRNKINAVLNKLVGGSQEHAFVRVSVPFSHTTREHARETGLAFIRQFYPVFSTYISDSKTNIIRVDSFKPIAN